MAHCTEHVLGMPVIFSFKDFLNWGQDKVILVHPGER